MTYECVSCHREFNLSGSKLNSKQRRAVVVCESCIKESMTPEQLARLLNPKEAEND